MTPTRRQVLASTGALALGGCLGFGKSSDADLDGPVATAPLPDDPSSQAYATMGPADAPNVVYFGNWKCPFCAQFSTGFLSDIVSEYVEPGTVSLTFRGLAYAGGGPWPGPDAPRATRAGLSVWNLDPDSYWAFHEYVMANQPPESREWATTKKLVSFAKGAGVGPIDDLRKSIKAGEHETAVRQTSIDAGNAGVNSTPTLVIGGEAVNPMRDEDATRSKIEQFADGS